jgi:hypothetical protein
MLSSGVEDAKSTAGITLGDVALGQQFKQPEQALVAAAGDLHTLGLVDLLGQVTPGLGQLIQLGT